MRTPKIISTKHHVLFKRCSIFKGNIAGTNYGFSATKMQPIDMKIHLCVLLPLYLHSMDKETITAALKCFIKNKTWWKQLIAFTLLWMFAFKTYMYLLSSKWQCVWYSLAIEILWNDRGFLCDIHHLDHLCCAHKVNFIHFQQNVIYTQKISLKKINNNI